MSHFEPWGYHVVAIAIHCVVWQNLEKFITGGEGDHLRSIYPLSGQPQSNLVEIIE